GTVFGATASVNYGDFAEDFKPQASTLFSTRWDTGIGEMGLLLNAAYSELATRTDSIQFGRPFRREATSLIGSVNDAVEDCPSMTGGTFSCVYLPAGARWSELDFDRERVGGAIASQWRPTDRTGLSLQALHSDYTMNWIEHSAWFQAGSYDTPLAPGTTATFDADGNFVSGRLVTTDADLTWVDDPCLAAARLMLQPAPAPSPTGATTAESQTISRRCDVGLKYRLDSTGSLACSFTAKYVTSQANNHFDTVKPAV